MISSVISVALIFAAGVASFLSPCVLPLVPAYLAAVTGMTFDELRTPNPASRRRALIATLQFLVGFLAVFVLLGASASSVGSLVGSHRLWLERSSAGLVAVFGVVLALGAQRVRFAPTPLVTPAPLRRGGPVVLGLAFAFCWTPCATPLLASILTLAGASASRFTGAGLLAVYGLGLGVPFIALALGAIRLLSVARRVRHHYRVVEIAAGITLLATAAALFSGSLYTRISWVQ